MRKNRSSHRERPLASPMPTMQTVDFAPIQPEREVSDQSSFASSTEGTEDRCTPPTKLEASSQNISKQQRDPFQLADLKEIIGESMTSLLKTSWHNADLEELVPSTPVQSSTPFNLPARQSPRRSLESNYRRRSLEGMVVTCLENEAPAPSWTEEANMERLVVEPKSPRRRSTSQKRRLSDSQRRRGSTKSITEKATRGASSAPFALEDGGGSSSMKNRTPRRCNHSSSTHSTKSPKTLSHSRRSPSLKFKDTSLEEVSKSTHSAPRKTIWGTKAAGRGRSPARFRDFLQRNKDNSPFDTEKKYSRRINILDECMRAVEDMPNGVDSKETFSPRARSSSPSFLSPIRESPASQVERPSSLSRSPGALLRHMLSGRRSSKG